MATVNLYYQKSPASAPGAWSSNPSTAEGGSNITFYFTQNPSYPVSKFKIDLYLTESSASPYTSYEYPPSTFGPDSAGKFTIRQTIIQSFLKQVWTVVVDVPTYTVSFSKNGGSGTDINPQSALAGDSITLPNPPDWTKTGFYFSGWNTKSDGTGTDLTPGSSYTIQANTTLYAKWVEIITDDATASFDKNGGSGTSISPITVKAGTNITLPSPSDWVKGAPFAEWNSRADGTGQSFAPGQSVYLYEDMVFYAKYATPAIAISYIHGTGISTYHSYGNYSNGSGSSTNHNSFLGYTTNADIAHAASVFNRGRHAITFNPGPSRSLTYYMKVYGSWVGGIDESSLTLDYTSHCANIPPTGVYPPTDSTVRFLYLTLKSSPSVHYVCDIFNEGSAFQNISWTDAYRSIDFAISPGTYTNSIGTIGAVKSGYLSNWTVSADGPSGVSFAVSTTDSLSYARSESVASGGVFKNYSFYSAITISAPSVSGYAFIGWYLNGTMVSTSATYAISPTTSSSASAATLVAKYNKTEAILYFNPNGGMFTDPLKFSKRIDYGSAYGALPTASDMTYDDLHSFVGWFTAATGGTQVTETTVVTTFGSQMLYAHWSVVAATCTVMFDYDGGSGSPASKTVTVGSTYGTLPSPTKANAAFVGWFTAFASGTQVTVTTAVNNDDDHTLYARWSAQLATITFNPNGGTTPTASGQYAAGEKYGMLPIPSNPGFDFVGWFTTASGGSEITTESIVSGTSTIYAHWIRSASILDPTYWARNSQH